ncbi:Vesicle trafficking between the ER and Golgi [Recurvomyces mirabilis]|nr:Vesicle trafficking between the ER and Golgi [Recurvomyces mirabilis]
MSYLTLRDRQVAAIKRVLNLNQTPAEDGTDTHHESNGLTALSAPIVDADGEPVWKVLVFDNLGRDVISSVLRVNDLRGWGITIHLYVSGGVRYC